MGSIGGSRGVWGGGACPLDHIGLCLCCVCSKSYFTDVHTGKNCYTIHFGRFYDSKVCISLYFGIFSYTLVFRPTYFTFWRSQVFTSHSLRPRLKQRCCLKGSMLSCLCILLFYIGRSTCWFIGVTIRKLLFA